MDSESSSNILIGNGERRIRIENPFSLKVGQVFTGFGIGCGIGIGVGRPLNLGAIPMLNQVMTATSGATNAFSGVGRHVNNTLKKVGAKNIEAGIGCGVGFGHGFGVGIAVKPGVVHQIQSCLVQALTKVMMKFGMSPSLSVGQGILPASLQAGMKTITEASDQNSLGSVVPLEVKDPHSYSLGMVKDGSTSSLSSHKNETSTNTISSLNTSYSSPTQKSEHLRSENNLLQIVLKHQLVIEELMQENEKLRNIMVEDLKVSPSKFQHSYSSGSKFPCTECFECRRKQRRR